MGRPTREQQEQRQTALLDLALDMFLERGFELTTIEDIAVAMGMSKRTVYARFADKTALFRAVVHRAVERYTIARDRLDALRGPDLEATLLALARLRVANVATPVVTKLQRLLAAHAYRFPDLAEIAFEEGAGPTVDFLAELFADHVGRGAIAPIDPQAAATAFLSLVVGGMARKIVLGTLPSEAEIDAHTRFAVDIFLNGLRGGAR